MGLGGKEGKDRNNDQCLKENLMVLREGMAEAMKEG